MVRWTLRGRQNPLYDSAEWYVGDVNLPASERRFVHALEALAEIHTIGIAQLAQRASMDNLFAIYDQAGELPVPILQSKLETFIDHADLYLDRVLSVEGHDEYVAHYRSRVGWRKKLATVVRDYGFNSYELRYFLDESLEASESEENQRKMAALEALWESKYATPQRRADKALFVAHRDVFLDDVRELRNHWYYRATTLKAAKMQRLPEELHPAYGT